MNKDTKTYNTNRVNFLIFYLYIYLIINIIFTVFLRLKISRIYKKKLVKKNTQKYKYKNKCVITVLEIKIIVEFKEMCKLLFFTYDYYVYYCKI